MRDKLNTSKPNELLMFCFGLMAVIFIVGPFIFDGAFRRPSGEFDLAIYASWLQGSLTIVAVAVAGFGFISQAHAQDRANNIASRAVILEHISVLTGHIGYMCAASLQAEYIAGSRIDVHIALDNMVLWLGAARNAKPEFKMGARATKGEVVDSAPFAALRNDIGTLLKIAHETDLDMLVDQRIKQIEVALKDFR